MRPVVYDTGVLIAADRSEQNQIPVGPFLDLAVRPFTQRLDLVADVPLRSAEVGESLCKRRRLRLEVLREKMFPWHLLART